jgi:DNA-directed RNA polymerase specialized sigma24 family protein
MDSDARPLARFRRPLVDALDFDRRFGLARPRLERICGSLVGASDAADVVHDHAGTLGGAITGPESAPSVSREKARSWAD